MNLYRFERSNLVMEDNPHAAQMDVAFDENAEVNVIRGPNSTTSVVSSSPLVLVEKVLTSNFNPSFSNVSRNNHSNRSVLVASRSLVSCTLKHDSVSILDILVASFDNVVSDDCVNCSLIDGRSECGVSVRR